MYRLIASFLFGIVLAASAHATYTLQPSVNSFVVSSPSISSGAIVAFSWKLNDAGGYSFLVSCMPGIKFKKDGAPFSCDTRVSSMLTTSDTIALSIINVSGDTRTITARIIPKDAAGADADAAGQNISLSVTTASQTITTFTTSATTTFPGQALTLSWTAPDLDGVNLSIQCKDKIFASSTNYTNGVFPCGTPIFAENLSPSGSLGIYISNGAPVATPFQITLLPTITPKTYDGSRAVSLEILIAPDNPGDPIVTSFTATPAIAESGTDILFTWETKFAFGVNIKFPCSEFITATSSKDPLTLLPCGAFAFPSARAPMGSLSFSFQNTAPTDQTIFVALIPSPRSGEYDATRHKTIPIIIRRPMPTSATTTSITTTLLQNATSTLSSIPSTTPDHFIFNQPLRRGSRGQQVTFLQEFLKRDRVLYPERIVNGYFGPATEHAVQRFQIKFGLAQNGVAGFGMIGPKTRIKLNQLQ